MKLFRFLYSLFRRHDHDYVQIKNTFTLGCYSYLIVWQCTICGRESRFVIQ